MTGGTHGRSGRMRPLLSTCALAAALVALGRPGPAAAQSYLGTANPISGATVNQGTPGQTVVTVTGPTAAINWTPTGTPDGNGVISFQNAGTTAIFQSSGGDYTVLNRIVPTDPANSISFNGTTQSFIGPAGGQTGGNIWFYSPGGIIVGATGRFDVGSLGLTTLDTDVDSFLASNGSYSFAATPGSRAKISIVAPDAAGESSIRATGANAYVALVSPRIDMAGKVNVNGSAAYVAAEAVDITIHQGLFDISVQSGSETDGSAADSVTFSHTGTTTGAASSSYGDARQIYMVAIPKNNAITMLVGGDVGFDASDATLVDGGIILSAGNDVGSYSFSSSSAPYVYASGQPTPGVDANIEIAGGHFLSPLNVNAVTDINAHTLGGATLAFDRAVDFYAGRNATLTAFTGSSVTAASNVSLTSNMYDASGEAIVGSVAAVVQDGASMTVGGNLSLTTYGYLSSESGDTTPPPIVGGSASIRAGSGGTLAISGDLALDARAYGGYAFSGDGGDGTGGTATILADGGTITVGGNASLTADGSGGASGEGATGGIGRGGTARLETDNGGTFQAGIITVSAAGTGGGDGGEGFSVSNGGAGIGGNAAIIANGGSIIADSATINANGTGANGGGNEFGYGSDSFIDGGSGGAGTGGFARLETGGGAIALGTLTLDAVGTGGQGGNALELTDEFGYGTGTSGNGGLAGSGQGGQTAILATGTGTIEVDSATLSADGLGGNGGTSDFAVGAAGGQGLGGGALGGGNEGVHIEVSDGGQITLASLTASANGQGGANGVGTTTASATASNEGGYVRIGAAGGSLKTGDTTLSATATGDNEGDGGTILIDIADAASGAYGALTTGLVSLDASGDTAGYIGIRNASADPAGAILFGHNPEVPSEGLSFYATVSGVAGGPAAIELTAQGGPVRFQGDATFSTDRNIAVHGTGAAGIIGEQQLYLFGDSIRVDHAGQTAIPTPTLSAQSIVASAYGDFLSSPGSLLRAADSIDITADNLNAAALEAGNSITAISHAYMTISDATTLVPVTTGDDPAAPPVAPSILLLAGATDSPIYADGNITVTGTLNTAGTIDIKAGRDVTVAATGRIQSDNRVTIDAGDDVLIHGAIVAAANPLPDPTGLEPDSLGTAAGLFITAGQSPIGYEPDPGNVSAIIADGSIDAGDRPILLSAGAIQVEGTISGRSLLVEVNDAPVSDASQSNDGGQLSADCLQGNVCLGTVNLTGGLSIGDTSYSPTPPSAVRIADGTVGSATVLSQGDIAIGKADGATHRFEVNGPLRLDASGGRLLLPGTITLAGNGSVQLLAAHGIMGAAATIETTSDAGLYLGDGGLTLASIRTGGALDQLDAAGTLITANGLNVSGAVTIADTLSVGQGSFQIDAGAISLGRLVLTGDAALSSDGALVIGDDAQIGGALSARGSSVSVNASHAVTIASAEATVGDLSINATELNVESATATGDILLGATNDLTVGTANAGGGITTTAAGNLSASQLAAASGIDLQAGGTLEVNNVTASGSDSVVRLRAVSDQGDASATPLVRIAQVVRGGSVEIASDGDVELLGGASIDANSGVGLTAGNAVRLAEGSSVGSGMTAPVSPGAFSLLLAGGPTDNVSIDAGSIEIDGTVQGLAIDLRSAAIAIGPGGSVGNTDTQTLTFTNRAGQTFIGGEKHDDAYSLSNAEVARTRANRISIIAPDADGDTVIDTLDLLGSAAANGGNLVGNNAAFLIQGGRSVRVQGAVTMHGAVAGDTLAIGATDRIDVVTPTGSIGLFGESENLAGRLSLAANTITVASQQAIDALGRLSSASAKSDRLDTNDGEVKPEGYLQANAMEFRAGIGLFIQNSGGAASDAASHAGFTVGAGGVTIITTAPQTQIAINGRQLGATGTFVTGSDLIPLLTVGAPDGTAARFDRTSTANGCLIVSTSCQAIDNGVLPPVQDVIGTVLTPADENDPSGDAPGTIQRLSTPLIDLPDFDGLGVTPLIDDPVTGAGNEQFWSGGDGLGMPGDIDQQVTSTRRDDDEQDGNAP